MMLLWLLLSMTAATKRGSYRNGHEATPAPTASDPRVRRADALNR